MSTEPTPIRWGIMGTGGIAARFVEGLRLVPGAEVVAVGSRAQATAEQFGEQWGIARRHGDYTSLATDDEVDVVYVATPHPGHHEASLLCLKAGRHVLCEKPLAMNATQAEEMIEAARSGERFLMEGMWTRCQPAMVEIARMVHSGEIGEVTTVTATFGERFPYDPHSRWFAPELGGGALLDLGVYPVALASMLLGEPTVLSAQAVRAPTGVDAQTGIVLTGANGGLATLTCSMVGRLPLRATIAGTEATIEVTDWIHPTEFVVHRRDEEPQTLRFPREGNGFEYEGAHVGAMIAQGALESPLMSWQESLSIARTLDTVREQIGLRYPEGVG
ncbi:Gfo/Idh/MocA family protein [Salinactinospora qingdaonensis]|uniref:Gfo/Idh/MocA family oxidoreductase n=1 Tax=Salinactinospora qingdaonensis TaxID=702744 RepID=A0ABP7GAQ7_9ACTN